LAGEEMAQIDSDGGASRRPQVTSVPPVFSDFTLSSQVAAADVLEDDMTPSLLVNPADFFGNFR